MSDSNNPISMVSDQMAVYGEHAGFGLLQISDFDNKYLYVEKINAGATFEMFNKLKEISGFNLDELADLMHVNSRTLRRLNSDVLLNSDLSERVVELLRLYQIGINLFGKSALFRQWLDSPIAVLNYKKPKNFLNTSFGIDILRDILGRIEHGVYS